MLQGEIKGAFWEDGEMGIVAQVIDKTQKPRQLNDYVYEAIKEMILNNEIPVGTQLKPDGYSVFFFTHIRTKGEQFDIYL